MISKWYVVNGKEFLFVFVIEVEEVFMYCFKLFIRFWLWYVDYWFERKLVLMFVEWVIFIVD